MATCELVTTLAMRAAELPILAFRTFLDANAGVVLRCWVSRRLGGPCRIILPPDAFTLQEAVR